MKQILQNIRTGKLNVSEVPEPIISGSGVLVATQASLISAGTEKMLIDFASKGFIGKAKSRPNDVKQVIEKIKRDGLRSTIHSVLTRLNQPMPLGYSSAGIVIAKSEDISDIRPGDKVACGGAGHAELMFVPKNLAVKVPENVDFESACFATLGSIALQGVRVAELIIGEKIAVIGLGLLGLITVQIAKAAGCRVIGADINPSRFELAKQLGCDITCTNAELANEAAKITNNIGVDAVIITAATKSNEPVELASAIARKKGRISVVGAVKMDIPRGPFYEKELQLRISTSYGPGRYDSNYEEKGIDYPQPYVPWTEQRNMACIIDLISQRKLDVKSLITHHFDVAQAENAYKIVRGEVKEPFIGIVLTYPQIDQRKSCPKITAKKTEPRPISKDKLGIGIIGAGTFANITMLPALKNIADYEFVAIADINTPAAKHTQQKYGFGYSTADYKEILKDDSIDFVFVTTRHDTHAQITLDALDAGKNVMVEKPLCLTEDQFFEIIKKTEQKPNSKITVGFNRRFAPMAVQVKEHFIGKGPLSVNYICNAGFVPKQSWVQDPKVGGGRILGEACHFIDWLIWLTDSEPQSIYAQSIGLETAKALKEDNVMISIKFDDGSIGTVSYLASGDKSYTKEHIEVFGDGSVGIINDFRKGFVTSNGKTKKLSGKSKGHFEQWQAVAQALKTGSNMPVSFEDVAASMWATFKAIESLNTGQVVKIK